MQIRQKQAARDIASRQINLRSVGRGSIRSLDQAYVYIEEILPSLTPGERKQWESYSTHEKEQIIHTVSRRVETRTRYTDPRAAPRESHTAVRNMSQAYRIREPEKAKAGLGTYETAAVRSGDSRAAANGGNVRLAEAGPRPMTFTCRPMPNLPDSQTAAFRFTQKADYGGYARPYMNTSAFQATATAVPTQGAIPAEGALRAQIAVQAQNAGHPTQETNGGQMTKNAAYEPTGRGEKEKDPPRLHLVARRVIIGAMAREELEKKYGLAGKGKNGKTASSGGSGSLRSKAMMQPGGRQSVAQGTFSGAGGRSLANGKNQKKPGSRGLQDSDKKKKMLFANELTGILREDSRKKEGMKKAQWAEAVDTAEMEREVGKGTYSTVTLPARLALRYKMGVEAAKKKAAAAKAGSMNYMLVFGGILLFIIIIIMLIAGIIAAYTGTAEDNSTAYSVAGTEIVAYAETWIGITQYDYGAAHGSSDPTDWQDYSDCSSFVHGVFNHFGITVGGATGSMESDGTLIPGGISDALPGDMVLFFDSSGKSQHVGIYAGNGMIVHNSSTRGYVVEVSASSLISYFMSKGGSYEVRRIVAESTTGNNTDITAYTDEEMELIWAIVRQEAGDDYTSALAVISTAMNRVDSAQWSYLGSNALAQLTASGQFCYSIDNYWKQYLNGNVSDSIKQAVSDCLDFGIRNHSYTSFRSYYRSGSVRIGTNGNYYFNAS